jgi:superfamily I DNA/RNA helicase
VSGEELEKKGWFRTIHSSVMRLLGIQKGQIVNFDTAWLRTALSDDKIEMAKDQDDGEGWTSMFRGQSPAVAALALWDVARNRLLPYHQVWDELEYRMGGRVSWLDGIADGEYYIKHYEQAKRLEGRLDFSDCILRYAGYRMTLDGPEKVEPLGGIPDVQAYIFDECQDTSPLLDAAAQRLASRAEWWYVLGDKEQAIYQWAGAEGDCFMRWDAMHEEYLPKTWRCAQKIIETGLRLIYLNDDISRELRVLAVEPRCPGGIVEEGEEEDLIEYVGDPSRSTLVMARTNAQATTLQNRLTAAKIPWKSVRTGRRWPPQAATRTSDAFEQLAQGGMIDGEGWRRVVAGCPVNLLVRGTKSRFLPAASREEADFVTLASVKEYGGTDDLVEYLRSGKWQEVVGDDEREAAEAKKKWGALADDPNVIVSTIHGTKGMEADRVLLCTGIYGPVLKNLMTPEGQQEERRCWYVGCTRARDELVLLKSRGRNYQDIYEAIQ